MVRAATRGFAAAALALALAACDDPQPPAAPAAVAEPADGRPRVALVLKTLTNPFFLKMERGARSAADAFGADLLVRAGVQETSIHQQIAIVDELIAADVSAIVIAPGDSVRLIPAVGRAREAGIVVVNIDNRLDPDFLAREAVGEVPFVGIDNEAGAYAATTVLLGRVRPPAEAFVLEGIRGAANAEARRRGAARAFTEADGITAIHTATANWKIDEAYDVTRRMMDRHPQISLVFAANDMMALGAARFLKDDGRLDVRVAGFDALDEAMQAILTGELVATVDQQADRQGYIGVDYAMRLLRGETVPPVTLVDAVVLDRDTLAAGQRPAGGE